MPRRSPKSNPELQAPQEWLGYLQPRGLVVAPVVMWEAGRVLEQSGREPLERREPFREALQPLGPDAEDDDNQPRGFRRARSPAALKQRIAPYVLDPAAHLAEPVRFKVLRAATPEEARLLEAPFDTLPVLPTPADLWQQIYGRGRSMAAGDCPGPSLSPDRSHRPQP